MSERACRVCGCTDERACPGGCWWVEPDLCSACRPKLAPVRLQLSRTKGFDLQALSLTTNGLPAVNCARPGKWGNPIRLRHGTLETVKDGPWARDGFVWQSILRRGLADADAVALYAAWITGNPLADAKLMGLVLALSPYPPKPSELHGRNLACWCKPGEPCHADVLLELANR